ncbi:MAG TPA: hypothetical protein VK400_03475, partial [Pyrinomonadaceae bacterium]|nr:hypothetical protein [Pyrinomonadaceae bacterium]
MFSHFKTFGLLVSLCLASVLFIAGQENKPQQQQLQPDKKPKKEEKPKQQTNDLSKLATAETVAESTILVYGGLVGRQNLQQIRRTTVEVGRTAVTGADGKIEQIPYTKRVLRGENLEK